jgi:hypothetical protein
LLSFRSFSFYFRNYLFVLMKNKANSALPAEAAIGAWTELGNKIKAQWKLT